MRDLDQHFPTNVQIVADEHVDIQSLDFAGCNGRIYVLAHHEAVSQIPLSREALARRLHVTPEDLEALQADPNTMTLLQRLQVAYILNETAEQCADGEDRIAFRRFLARFLDEHTRAMIAQRFRQNAVTAGVHGDRAVIDTMVDIGAVELLEHLPPPSKPPNERE